MKFRLWSLLALTLFMAVIFAWWSDRTQLQRTNLEAARLASDLYRNHLLRELEKPYGSLFPPGWNAIVTGKGDVLDLTTPAGRAALLDRIDQGKTDFRVMVSPGHIMGSGELLVKPYPIYRWQPSSPPGPENSLSSNGFRLPWAKSGTQAAPALVPSSSDDAAVPAR